MITTLSGGFLCKMQMMPPLSWAANGDTQAASIVRSYFMAEFILMSLNKLHSYF